MTEESEQPFLVAPRDAGVEALNSIAWPSLLENTDQICQSSTEAVKIFHALSDEVRSEFARYPDILLQAMHKFADTGDSVSTVEWIIESLPAMLFRKDRFGCIPIEVAFDSANATAARLMLKVAECSGKLQKLLSYRNQQTQTLMMLAVNLNSPDSADIIQTLMSHDISGLYRCYDNEGHNVFHTCTRSGFHVSFGIILDAIINLQGASNQVNLKELKKALEMTDTKQLTPIHYICVSGKVDMLDILQEFLTRISARVDFDVCFAGSCSSTPLMLGVENDHYDICKWLLEKGSVNVHKKQHSTCLTALHFAVRAGNPELISLLIDHGADSDYCDSDCEDLPGYKTPLQMAKAEPIPNKQACIRSLSESPGTVSQVNGLSRVRLDDRSSAKF